MAVVAVPAIVLAIPILDTTFVTIARMLEGRPVAEGGRDHTSHGLVALGVSEERALWILWSLAAAGGVVGLFVRTVERTTALVLGGVLVAGLSLLGAFLLLQRMQRAEAGAAENGESVQRYRRLRELHERFPLLLIGLDVFLIGLAYYAAYVIRWDADQLPAELPYFRSTLVIVIAAKVAAFAAAGVYRPRLRFFGLSDSLRVVRANLLGTLLTVSILLLVQRVGLSRGVVLVDLLVCTALTGAARFSFRFMEGALQRWSSMGVPVVVLGAVDDIGPAFSWIVDRRLAGLRPVALADPSAASPLTHFKGYPVYGRPDALARALRGTEAHAVVLVEGERSQEARRALDEYLETHGSVDAFVVRCTIERLRVAGPGAAVPHPAD
ncbi:MAG: hypothetical protein D6701_07375 [Gemmatimonadetes bacterium]|nr:MAG: hypothetical protein D6701_07375 [Gemmatimonadota bacterium]